MEKEWRRMSQREPRTASVPRTDRESELDPLRQYLREISKAPLLTASQEVDLAMRLESGVMAGELLDSIAGSDRMDELPFREVVTTVVMIRERQDDPATKLRRDGIGREA